MYFCNEHSNNALHGTADCFTVKNRASVNALADNKNTGKPRSFSNKSLWQELNLLSRAKSSNKRKILSMYSKVIEKETAKLDHIEKKTARAAQAENSDASISSNSSRSPNAISKNFSENLMIGKAQKAT